MNVLILQFICIFFFIYPFFFYQYLQFFGVFALAIDSQIIRVFLGNKFNIIDIFKR